MQHSFLGRWHIKLGAREGIFRCQTSRRVARESGLPVFEGVRHWNLDGFSPYSLLLQVFVSQGRRQFTIYYCCKSIVSFYSPLLGLYYDSFVFRCVKFIGDISIFFYNFFRVGLSFPSPKELYFYFFFLSDLMINQRNYSLFFW